jgi:hypothetical protein
MIASDASSRSIAPPSASTSAKPASRAKRPPTSEAGIATICTRVAAMAETTALADFVHGLIYGTV